MENAARALTMAAGVLIKWWKIEKILLGGINLCHKQLNV